ncbi:helix-turn-helix transcriptional regulator [Novosphingobium sp. YJ-S2-02]|uniref:Helix-turn-helix transcriptional regulator n=1 Tax=Novosphingobium aureum TaxID=2792964 RepID=A0A931HB47_9SPHN|nr:helix-turn-helix transcriptional regulator [Novosphingobium aureum]MBH0112740.1 helix-turn-helix transcriptional regulator [Novosphingobium aureum]
MVHTHGVRTERTLVNVESVSTSRDNVDMENVRTTGQTVAELVARAGLSMRAFAKACGYATASGVQRYMDPEFDANLKPDVAVKMVEALKGKGEPPIAAEEVYALVGMPATNAAPVHYEGASMDRMRQDVPILGTALGADRIEDDLAIEQTHLFTDEIIGYAKRPVILDGRADVYGIYVQGTSMEPRYEDGSIVFAETKRPARIGDSVIVYLRKNGDAHEADDGESARTVLVKRLVKKSGSFVELEQYNPRFTFRLDGKEVLKMHRVLTMDDLLS